MSRIRPLLALAATLLGTIAMLGLSPSAAMADHSQISSFQDDAKLIYSNSTTVFSTLQRLFTLGVEEVRVNVEWNTIAPDSNSTTPPVDFDAENPNDYPAANWAPYDRLVQDAALFGIKVQFNLTGPVPLWAVDSGAPTTASATHWYPSPAQFLEFAFAIGYRYSGSFNPGNGVLPAVSNWSIWNEPNQPGWLAPQWRKVGKTEVPESPVIYRNLVNYAYYGLYASGHTVSNDTILVGETAPEGDDTGSDLTPMNPLPFLETLYCVNAKFKRLRGKAASEVGCPTKGTAKDFIDANGGLFYATGFAHHPYDFSHNPLYSFSDRNEAPLADIGRLETFLNDTFRTYGVKRQIPLYFTEYGYETDPPNPNKGVSETDQADWLNESDYLAWRNPRVKQIAQFLLYDSPPNDNYKPTQYNYWDTFQSGLLFLDGTVKPSYFAYRMPLWLPSTTARRGAKTFVWGQVRPADRIGSQPVLIQWRSAKGKWRTIATAHTVHGTGYYDLDVTLPGTGDVQAVWKISRSLDYTSRTQAVTVKGAAEKK